MNTQINWHGNFATVLEKIDKDQFVIELCDGEQIAATAEEITQQDNPEFEQEV